MLSILIPVYNYDIFKFVSKLHYQCKAEKIKFEIIIIEDGSVNTFKNQELQKLDSVNYIKQEKNIGRAKIRNLLAEKAKYNNLLFIDCDSDIYDNYIKKYISGRGGYIMFEDGTQVDVSERKKKEFIRLMKEHARST